MGKSRESLHIIDYSTLCFGSLSLQEGVILTTSPIGQRTCRLRWLLESPSLLSWSLFGMKFLNAHMVLRVLVIMLLTSFIWSRQWHSSTSCIVPFMHHIVQAKARLSNHFILALTALGSNHWETFRVPIHLLFLPVLHLLGLLLRLLLRVLLLRVARLSK